MPDMRIALLALIGCSSASPSPAAPRAPKLDDLAWLAGTWHSDMLDSHWEMVAGTLYGVALNDGGFEVNLIGVNDDDGKPTPVTLVALENGRDPSRFELVSATPQKIELADAQRRVVRVTKDGAGWRGEFVDQPPRHPIVFVMKPGSLDAARQLQDADRAFAADTAKDGADGWARWFAADGAMWRKQRIEGAAIREAMVGPLAKGTLAWTPLSSGARGDFGYTLGTFTFAFTGQPPREHGSYCTIWKKQADGSWKVVFDIGRPA